VSLSSAVVAAVANCLMRDCSLPSDVVSEHVLTLTFMVFNNNDNMTICKVP